MKELRISENDSSRRLDKFLLKLFKALPEGMIYKWLRKKRIKVNGQKAENSYKLNTGDVLTLYINDEFFPPDFDERRLCGSGVQGAKACKAEGDAAQRLKDGGVEIIYSDGNVVIAGKKSGIKSHGGKDSVLGLITDYLIESGEYEREKSFTFAPALCNRLDRNTEGLIIIAKNAAALREMNERIRHREVHKLYMLRAEGIFDCKAGIIQGYLSNDTEKNITSFHNSYVKGSKYSETKYRVIREENGRSIVEAQLLTGRKHQLRVHFSHIGHPICGDVKYGAQAGRYKGYQQLCAYKLVFDFKTAGLLSELDKKTFVLKPNNLR